VLSPRESVPTLRRGPVLLASAGLVAILTIALLGALGRLRAVPPGPELASQPAPPEAIPSVAAAPPAPEPPPLKLSVLTLRLARHQTLGAALRKMALAPGQARAVLDALRGKLPFRRIQPGDQLRLERVEDDGALRRFSYRQNAADEWIVTPADDGTLRGEKRAVALTTEVARVDVEIRGSVWESLQRAGEDPALAVMAADVLAWDVDFYHDMHPGDRLKVLVEKVHADGTLLRYGDILAAEYTGASTGTKRLFRYTDSTGQTAYYDDAGQSARRGFLKLPLRYAHLTSRFGTRRHPILGYVREHKGVDYGAPKGTPVWAVSEGVVERSGWAGGCGKAVTLRHQGGLETIYCHLSAVYVRAGEHVGQKQVVGAVGQTGLATGPHLHFAVKRNGVFVNPLSLRVPRAAPLAKAQRADFDAKIAPLRAKLDERPDV
jgi:murein DD-endopeptidase MepM/ murein hydrolase activator NlpD